MYMVHISWYVLHVRVSVFHVDHNSPTLPLFVFVIAARELLINHRQPVWGGGLSILCTDMILLFQFLFG